MTTWKSLWRMTDEALAALAKSSPMRMASYPASLLVVGNWSQIAHSMISPLGDWRTTPIPPAHLLDNLFVWTLQGVTPQLSISLVVNSTMKSTKAWDLIMILGQYCMSNSLSSIAHKTNCPAAFELSIIFQRGFVHLYYYGVCLEVWPKLAGCCDQSEG